MKKHLLLLFSLLISLGAWAQRTVVSGTVVSEATGEALAGASVVAGGVTVVTNDDGFFTLKSDSALVAVTVSYVGYRSQRVELKERRTDGLTVALRPTAIQLREVLVMGGDARDLVMTAIEKIPRNYSRQPERYHCFYRETAMKRQHFICVAEGVVDMYKTSYDRGTARDRVAIHKGRRLLSSRQSDTLTVKVLGGPVLPVQLDLVKNTDFLLNAEDLADYDMQMDVPTSIGDRMQYVVSLSPRVVKPYALFFGKLYIDQETLAFTRIELSLDVSDPVKATQAMLYKKPVGVRFRPKEMSILVDYRYDEGVMHISYLRTTFRFNCDWKRRLFATSFTACCEMAVTGRSPGEDKPIRGRDSFDQRDAFFDKVDYFRDPVFWQDYNIIEPTISLDRAIGRLLKRMNN